ncbi:hypothetical protein H6784_00955 [Candidatus Nomurabacteria bacterium]|nr:hypothetical protein [Candidatus Kaiserbacteria bacterium]MCB9813961.1 hypothetical protein [Candidatus Nomurabacteria bacterium]
MVNNIPRIIATLAASLILFYGSPSNAVPTEESADLKTSVVSQPVPASDKKESVILVSDYFWESELPNEWSNGSPIIVNMKNPTYDSPVMNRPPNEARPSWVNMRRSISQFTRNLYYQVSVMLCTYMVESREEYITGLSDKTKIDPDYVRHLILDHIQRISEIKNVMQAKRLDEPEHLRFHSLVAKHLSEVKLLEGML